MFVFHGSEKRQARRARNAVFGGCFGGVGGVVLGVFVGVYGFARCRGV